MKSFLDEYRSTPPDAVTSPLLSLADPHSEPRRRHSPSTYEPLHLQNAELRKDGSFHRTTTHQDVYSYWFFLIRRCLHTYYFCLSCFLISLLGLNLVLQLFFALLAPAVEKDEHPGLLIAGLFGLMVFYSYLFAKILSFGAILIKDVWYFQQYYSFRAFTFGMEGNRELGGLWDLSVQLAFILTLDVAPLFTGIIAGIVYRSFGKLAMYWLFVGCSAAAAHIGFWWAAHWCKDLYVKVCSIRRYQALKENEANGQQLPLIVNDIDEDAYPTFYNDDSNVLIRVMLSLREKKRRAIAYTVLLALAVVAVAVFWVYQQYLLAGTIAVLAALILYSVVVIWIQKYIPRTRKLVFPRNSTEAHQIFWWKHWGIDPSLTFHTCSFVFVLFAIFTVVFLRYGQSHSIAFSVAALVSVCFIAGVTVFRPQWLWITVLGLVSIFALLTIILNFASLGVAVGFTALAVIVATQGMVNPHHERLPLSTFVLFLLCFFTIGGAILILGSMNQTGQLGTRALTNETWPIREEGDYPICKSQWYSGNLDILDFAFIGNIAYDELIYAQSDLATWFGNSTGHPSDFQIVYYDNSTVTFYELYSKELNLSVISIRGTLGPKDDVQDLDLYLEVITMQFAALTLPFYDLIPANFTVDVIGFMSLIKDKIQIQGRHYYDTVTNHVLSISGRQIILVGHSLGGTIAKIVGDRLGHPVIAFSAPGVTLSRNKFNVTLQEIYRLNVNIVPYKDIVPTIDEEGGEVQYIDCYETTYQCHLLMTTTCTLLKTCGDKYNRGINNCSSGNASGNGSGSASESESGSGGNFRTALVQHQ